MKALSSLRWSISLLGLVGVVAALLVAGQGRWAQQRMGQTAGGAFVAKDVVADILPPPLYLIEMRLVLSQALEGGMEPNAARLEVDRLAGEPRHAGLCPLVKGPQVEAPGQQRRLAATQALLDGRAHGQLREDRDQPAGLGTRGVKALPGLVRM